MVERVLRKHEATGSIPVSSTFSPGQQEHSSSNFFGGLDADGEAAVRACTLCCKADPTAHAGMTSEQKKRHTCRQSKSIAVHSAARAGMRM